MIGCGGGSSDTKSPPITSPPDVSTPAAGELILTTADKSSLKEDKIEYYGDVYSGTYNAPDGVSIDVRVSGQLQDFFKRVSAIDRTNRQT